MENVAALLEGKGYTLRSGGAKGADTAFEKGGENKKLRNVSQHYQIKLCILF